VQGGDPVGDLVPVPAEAALQAFYISSAAVEVYRLPR
jgi:hypothetical protein